MELYVTKCIKQSLADKGATVLKDWLVQFKKMWTEH